MTATPEELLRVEAHFRAAAAAVSSVDEAKQLAEEIAAAARLYTASRWEPYPWQHPHIHEGTRHCDETCHVLPRVRIPTHGMWLQLGGRGTGKTEGAARYVNDHVHGPACSPRIKGGHRILIVAPTQGDAVEACVTGPSGLQTVNPGVKLVGGAGGLTVRWPSGARARLVGASTPEDVERLRAAGNTCLVWLEELAAQRKLAEALTHTAMGLRVGPSPHYVGSTTPKPRPEVKELLTRPGSVITAGRTADAVHLDATVRDALFATYDGTRTGRQELDGEVLDDVEGALLSQDTLDRTRIASYEECPELTKTVVTVDPSTADGTGDACGITVQALSRDLIDTELVSSTGLITRRKLRHGYVLEDATIHGDPEAWAQKVSDTCRKWGTKTVVAEGNQGGRMVRSVIRNVDATLRVKIVHAKNGKAVRAEPAVQFFQQGRWHIVGVMPKLEEQWTTWVPAETRDSPDNLDAQVWGVHHLMIPASRTGSSTTMPDLSRNITG